VTSTTTAFGVATADGSFYKLDSNGNAKVAQEIQKDGTKVATANVQVKGSLQGDMIQVDSVLMQ
jgi:hypothetical protein